MVLLTIMQPQSTNTPEIGWTSHNSPAPQVPRGRLSSTQPCETKYAKAPTMLNVVGIGVPSKYFDLPVASLGRCETVTLKRASRVRPQRTKKVSRNVSRGERIPIAKAEAAGARPKEI